MIYRNGGKKTLFCLRRKEIIRKRKGRVNGNRLNWKGEEAKKRHSDVSVWDGESYDKNKVRIKQVC